MLIKNITIKPTDTIVSLTVGTATKIVLVSSSAEVADRNIERIVTTHVVEGGLKSFRSLPSCGDKRAYHRIVSVKNDVFVVGDRDLGGDQDFPRSVENTRYQLVLGLKWLK